MDLTLVMAKTGEILMVPDVGGWWIFSFGGEGREEWPTI